MGARERAEEERSNQRGSRLGAFRPAVEVGRTAAKDTGPAGKGRAVGAQIRIGNSNLRAKGTRQKGEGIIHARVENG